MVSSFKSKLGDLVLLFGSEGASTAPIHMDVVFNVYGDVVAVYTTKSVHNT